LFLFSAQKARYIISIAFISRPPRRGYERNNTELKGKAGSKGIRMEVDAIERREYVMYGHGGNQSLLTIGLARAILCLVTKGDG